MGSADNRLMQSIEQKDCTPVVKKIASFAWCVCIRSVGRAGLEEKGHH
ncbi:MAG: hypothetical protein KJZ86_18405 [Caldilineaceae bacterium]|nr:hypothetical protein [Caldilineaceae bacterium]HRJ42797.1 hypothetical protein [Caldilineaceae bacterium]